MKELLFGPLLAVWKHRQLVAKSIAREIAARYRGSVGGLSWAVIQPLLMLAVYTFVFSTVFKARWPAGRDAEGIGFAVVLFVGLIVQGIFAECASRAPTLLVNNANFVKKVVFPLEILPIVTMGVALFHAAVNVGALLLVMLFAGTPFHLEILLTPVVLLPFVILTVGISWLLAAFGVFLRDIGQIIGLLITALLFLSPVFYPLSAIPEDARGLLYLNPLTVPIEQIRESLLWGMVPSWQVYIVYAAVSWAIASIGYGVFQRLRGGFADVL
jgi:lipopolysaccharide transport system permease protein